MQEYKYKFHFFTFSGSKMCPVDDTSLSETPIFPDNFCKRNLMELECYCSGKNGGCQWTGPLKDLKVGGTYRFVFKISGKVTHVLQVIVQIRDFSGKKNK